MHRAEFLEVHCQKKKLLEVCSGSFFFYAHVRCANRKNMNLPYSIEQPHVEEIWR